jgi:hypothetical protein
MEKHDNSPLIQTISRAGLANGAVKEPRNGFFLHDGDLDPKAGILNDRHKVPLLYPCGNDLAIMVRTGSAMLRWNTLYLMSILSPLFSSEKVPG